MDQKVKSKFTEIEGRKIHYLEGGIGETILLIHGFPTSSYLWRNIIKPLSKNYNTIAIDLPGYGKSDKNMYDSYKLQYYNKIIEGFVQKLNIEKLTIGVHDLGGPIGLYWMVKNIKHVDRLILFNTVVYPKYSWAVILFNISSSTPFLKNLITTPYGIKKNIFFGVHHKEKLTDDIISNYQSPFLEKESRRVLLKSIKISLNKDGLKEISEKLHEFKGPIKVIYGKKDWILPDVSETMKKIKKNLPQTDITELKKCSHFLQEDAPNEISKLIEDFMENNKVKTT